MPRDRRDTRAKGLPGHHQLPQPGLLPLGADARDRAAGPHTEVLNARSLDRGRQSHTGERRWHRS